MILASLLTLAAAATTADTASPELTWPQRNPGLMLVLLVGGVLLMYQWLVSGPQRRQKQEREQLLGAVRKGDRVVTIGGIHGRVAKVDAEAKIVTVTVAKGVEIEFAQSAISSITRPKDEGEKPA